MTDSRNVVNSLERANNKHSDHNTEKKNEKFKNYQRKSRIKWKLEKKMLLLNQMVKKYVDMKTTVCKLW